MTYSEPAFPFQYDGDGGQSITHKGMSLRDYFAARAMPAFIQALYTAVAGGSLTFDNDDEIMRIAAIKAYSMADAMLVQSPQGSETP